MSSLSQIGRGGVLLTSMALVACYIDVYATGKFPWQHAAVAETPTTVPPAEWTSDPAIEQAQYVQTPAGQQPPVFLPGSKSAVAPSMVVGLDAAAYGTANTAPAPTPLFLSGTKTFTGQTTVLPGTLTLPPSPTPIDPKAPSFMGGSKTIMLPTRLPESATTPPTQTTTPPPQQFMSGFKSPGPSVMQGSNLPTVPQAAPPPNGAPTTNANAPTPTPLFMSGSKSMGPAVMPMTIPGSDPRVQTPTQIPGQGKPLGNMPQQASPQQQQTAPLKIAPPNAPQSPAGSY